jgi:hypothetical protein
VFRNRGLRPMPEKYSLNQAAPGRVNNIVNIHNPSIEVHTVDTGLNTGGAVILVRGAATGR